MKNFHPSTILPEFDLKVCIVTTLCDAQNFIKTFVDYHISIGFAHIYLFIDKIDEFEDYKKLQLKNTTLIPYDNELVKLWLQTPSLRSHFAFVNKEVMARQNMNVEVAIELARQANYDWILHIDSDELFYLDENYKTVSEYFSDKDNYDCISFTNHEAIPEVTHIEDFFEEVTLFKKNLRCFSDKKQQEIFKIFGQKNKYFRFYDNGKTAGNLKTNLRCLGPHLFSNVGNILYENDISILHYPCCGYNYFIKKYRTLGEFKDKWFDNDDINELLPFHIWSRNAVLSNDDSVSIEFYKNNIMFQNTKSVTELLEQGIFFRKSSLIIQENEKDLQYFHS